MTARDSSLIAALVEIDVILKKYDVAGFMTLVSRTHGTARLLLPSWGLVSYAPDGQSLEIHAGGFSEAAEDTLHLLESLRDATGDCFGIMEDLVKEANLAFGLVDADVKTSGEPPISNS